MLGDYYRYQKDFNKALEYYEKSRQNGYKYNLKEIDTILNGQLAFTYRATNDFDKALEFSKKSIENSIIQGNRKGEQIQKVLSGEILLEKDNLQEAKDLLIDASGIANETGDLVDQASCFRALAKYNKKINDFHLAIEHIEQSIDFFIKTNKFQYARESWEIAAEIYEEWSQGIQIDEILDKLISVKKIAEEDIDIFILDRYILYEKLILSKLKEIDDSSDYIKKILNLLIYEVNLDSNFFVPQIIQFCLDGYLGLDKVPSQVFEDTMDFITIEQQIPFYTFLVEASVVQKIKDKYEFLIKDVIDNKDWDPEIKFRILEPVELIIRNDSVYNGKLAVFYENEIINQVNKAIREKSTVPSYVEDMKRALYFLDSHKYDEIEAHINSQVANVQKKQLVGTDYKILQKEQFPDLSDKKITLLGGQTSVRNQVKEELMEKFRITDVKEVPPSWEKNVSTKIVSDAIQNTDCIVVIHRQMTHKMTNSLNASLEKDQKQLIIYPEGFGKSSICRKIEEFFMMD